MRSKHPSHCCSTLGTVSNRPGNRHLDAVEAQATLLEYWPTPRGEMAAKSWTERQDDESDKSFGLTYSRTLSERLDGVLPEWVFIKAEMVRLTNAPTYWVSSEMVDMVNIASQDLPDDPLYPMDVPTPSGFAYLDQAIYRPDNKGKRVNIKAVMWYPTVVTMSVGDGERGTARAFAISYYSDAYDPTDEAWGGMSVDERKKRGIPRLVLLDQTIWFWNEPGVGPSTKVPLASTQDAALGLFGTEDFPAFPTNPEMRLGVTGDGPGAAWLQSLWRIATQTFVQVSKNHYGSLPRLDRRQLDRVKKPPAWDAVLTIDLRRKKHVGGIDMDHQGDGERWSHRWVVDKHWRRQWYPSEQRHKWIFIHPFVKGPEHLPLVLKNKVRRVIH